MLVANKNIIPGSELYKLTMLVMLLAGFSIPTHAGLVADRDDGNVQHELVRAKLGIKLQSENESRKAKSKDILTAGDMLQIHVYPDNNAYIYLVHTDGKSVTLLNKEHYLIDGSVGLVMPSHNQYYQVDGASDKEIITIVVSDGQLKSLEQLDTQSTRQYQVWVELEAALSKKGKVELTAKLEKPFSIAGNVRGLEEEPFWESLRIYSGNSVVVKKYEFGIKE